VKCGIDMDKDHVALCDNCDNGHAFSATKNCERDGSDVRIAI
jgi:hypothetical protein